MSKNYLIFTKYLLQSVTLTCLIPTINYMCDEADKSEKRSLFHFGYTKSHEYSNKLIDPIILESNCYFVELFKIISLEL